MKPHRFEYVRARSGDQAVALLAELGPEARILAGGQSLMAVMNMRLAQPSALIDITRAEDLAYMRIEDGHLVIGAAVTQAQVQERPTLESEVPLLAQVFPHISHFQIRNRGTVCGSLAHADPSAELPLALAALGGSVVLRSRRRRRVLPAAEFFQGMLMTARQPDELVEAVRYPLARPGERFAFREFAQRHGDFAMASVAVAVSPDSWTVAVGGVADRPVALRLKPMPEETLAKALNDFAWDLQAQDDHHASAAYRRHLVRRLAAQALEEAGVNERERT